MDILSYRGPTAPGGVASTITRIFEEYESSGEWWFIRDSSIRCKTRETEAACELIEGSLATNHYRFCNNFLWPIFHDMPERAHFSSLELEGYRGFNRAVARSLATRKHRSGKSQLFVNDYQFALIPRLLSGQSYVFWHIPWPKEVRPIHVNTLCEIASSLLHARVIGFHTDEYAQNFLNFVEVHLHRFCVERNDTFFEVRDKVQSVTRRLAIFIAPLGIDACNWEQMARVGSTRLVTMKQLPYVLSVDRADYTKGIIERLHAINQFFQENPQWRQKVFFLQLGTRSREGLPEFDEYWNNCQSLQESINSRWGTSDWQPIVWVDTPKFAAELAAIYHRASTMLVNPLRDGLNLTAKEFVASMSSSAALGLSSGAGVWSEVAEGCVHINIHAPSQFAKAIKRCLEMEPAEKYSRSQQLKNKVHCNSLSDWWQSFRACCENDLSSQLKKACG